MKKVPMKAGITTMATTPLLQLLELSQPSTPVKEVEAA